MLQDSWLDSNPLRRTTTVPGISTRKESQSPAASGKSAAKQATTADPEKREEEQEKAAAASTRSRSQSPSVAVSPKVILKSALDDSIPQM